MSSLPFGRLYWKFLTFFFLAQLSAVIGIGLAIWAVKPDSGFDRPPPPAHLGSPENAPGFRPPPEGSPRRDVSPGPFRPGAPRPPVEHLLIGAVVSLVFAALLASYVARPIRRLREALRAAAGGKLAPGLAASMGRRNDELTDLCRDFDHMAGQLASLMEGQRRLLYDVSHELRSPLARLTAVIGLIRQQPDRLEDCLARLERESERMDRLLSELLTLSRLESGMVERGNEPVDVTEVLGDVISDAGPQATQAGCALVFDGGDVPAWVKGDAELLHRVFDNLLRNALTHAASGKWVRISVAENDASVCVRVEDRGPGVLSSETEQIFKPFYRSARSAGVNGHGLGLVIARQIVENHGGRIEAENRSEGGLCFSVFLPATAL